MKLHPYLAPGGREKMRALNASAIDRAHRGAPDVFTRAHAAMAHRAIAKWDVLMAAWYSAPLTPIHGDSHLGNCFEYATPDGPRVDLLDFQGVQWCRGMRDVQYFLVDSLEPDLLAGHESELIDLYVAELAARGVELETTEARAQYRAFSFQTLMVTVVSLGLGSLTEHSETVDAILRRSVAAIDRLGFDDWLARVGRAA
jgi:Ecdysteroid kinase-like family